MLRNLIASKLALYDVDRFGAEILEEDDYLDQADRVMEVLAEHRTIIELEAK